MTGPTHDPVRVPQNVSAVGPAARLQVSKHPRCAAVERSQHQHRGHIRRNNTNNALNLVKRQRV